MPNNLYHQTGEFEFLNYNSNDDLDNFHLHDTYEMFYVLQGSCECFIGDSLFFAEAGNVAMIPHKCIHKIRHTSSEYEAAAIKFSEDFIDDDNKSYFNSIFRRKLFALTNARLIGRAFSRIGAEWERLSDSANDEIALRLIRYYVNELILYMQRDKRKAVHAKEMHPCVDKIISFVNENYNKTITLDDAADALGFTRGYLSSIFIKNTGIKFRDYLNNIKIKHAKSMLENTKKPITEIAEKCGFNDGNYFSTAFKHAVGVSPAKYRQICANAEIQQSTDEAGF